LEEAEKKIKEDQTKEENSKKDENTEKDKDKDKNEQQEKQKEQEKYNWEYPDINKEFKILEGFYLEIFIILHLSISLFWLNIYEEENYQMLLFSDEENKIERPKYYSILMNYGIFEKSVTILFFIFNLICFAIIITLFFIKMIYDKIQQCFKSFRLKIILLILNIIYSNFIIVLIVLSGLCLSCLNDLEENENLNYFVVKKKLIGQIIVNSFILVFLIIIIIDNSRHISCNCKKKNNKNNNTIANKNDNPTQNTGDSNIQNNRKNKNVSTTRRDFLESYNN
jgi:hypothetical protein